MLRRGPTAAATARDFVTARLAEHGLNGLRDAAVLVTTELVTNVLVHTDCAPTVRVHIARDLVRVEVVDACPALPVPGVLDPTANCGRGLLLVEQFAQRWGVTRVPEAGKAVWFELVAGVPAAAEGLTADQLLELWNDDEPPAPAATGRETRYADERPETADPVRHVRVEGVPTALLHASKTHLDDLVRDLTLVNEAAQASGGADEELVDLAARLSQLAVDLVGFRNQIRRQALDAVGRGAGTLTLELDLPIRLRGRLLAYRQALDEADQHCAAGRLLVPVGTDEQAQFRRWKLDRIVDQLADAAHPTTRHHARRQGRAEK